MNFYTLLIIIIVIIILYFIFNSDRVKILMLQTMIFLRGVLTPNCNWYSISEIILGDNQNGIQTYNYFKIRDIKKSSISFFDIIEENQFIQCSCLKMKKGTTFRAHQHIWKPGKEKIIAQESWVVITGSVKCYFYDIDGTLLKTINLHVGDSSFTLEGGHNYEILEDNTIVYEFKTGPYEGQLLDKKFL